MPGMTGVDAFHGASVSRASMRPRLNAGDDYVELAQHVAGWRLQ